MSHSVVNFNKLVELAKEHKALWVETTERGDMPPTIFAERDGKLICGVISPQIDKYLGFSAAITLRKGLAADYITIIMDAHVKTLKPGENMKNYKSGDLQRQCDQEGACELGKISDCLICYRASIDGKIKMKTLPYAYHGKKAGVQFKWTEYGGDKLKIANKKLTDDIEDDSDIKVEGLIPDALRQIMQIKPILEEEETVKLAKSMGLSQDVERQKYHCARAMYDALTQEKYIVIDYQNHQAPYDHFFILNSPKSDWR